MPGVDRRAPSATMPGVTDGSGKCSPRRGFDVLGSGIWMTLNTTARPVTSL